MSEMGVVVRRARLEDAAAIAIIHVETWREAYRGVVPEAFLAAMSVETRAERWRDAIETPPRGQTTLVALNGDDVVGFAAYGAAQRDDAQPGLGELYAIYVTPRCWERGAGGALHAVALDGLGAERYRSAELWVLEANHRARRFYEHRGWAWDGSIEPHAFGDVEVPVVRYTTTLQK